MSVVTRRGGFTLVEVLVAVVFLTVVAVALGTASQQSTRNLQRSRLELEAARFLEAEVERLRILDYDSLEDGSRTEDRGIVRWTVVDSTDFRRLVVSSRYGSPATGLIADSVTLFRRR